MPALVRFDPYRDLAAMRDDVNRLFNRAAGGNGGSAWSPALDIVEAEDHVALRADLPGLGVDDVDVRLDGDVLTISGERRFDDEVEDGRYYRLERAYGSFTRSVTLPQSVQSDGITARFEDGVLEVRVPKAPEAKPRKIEIEPRS